VCVAEAHKKLHTFQYTIVFLPVDAYSGEITLENIPEGDLDDGIIKAVKWFHRSELGNRVVWPEWIKEDWFWQDAKAGFPEIVYTGVGKD